jgi:hypothetical protein
MEDSPLPSLQVGDRVRTVRLLMLLPEGSVGTVRRIYRVRNLCAIAFDNRPGLRMLLISDIELIEHASEAGRQ